MLAASAEPGLANNWLLEGAVVVLVAAAVSGIATYLWLQRRDLGSVLKVGRPRAFDSSWSDERLDQTVMERAAAMRLRVPLEKVGTKPAKVLFADGLEFYYFERDVHVYDHYIYEGITPIDRSTIHDPPKVIVEWGRNEKIQWLTDHPLEMDESGAQ